MVEAGAALQISREPTHRNTTVEDSRGISLLNLSGNDTVAKTTADLNVYWRKK